MKGKEMQKELRYFVAQELRAIGSAKQPKIEGYAATFNTVANIGGQFNEVIKAGAFKRTLASDTDVVALFNHDDNMLLGRKSAGTLTLEEDGKGLKFSCELPDTTVARDCYANLKAGNLKECSFGFFVNGPDGERWTQQPDGTMLRTLLDVTLFDVSVVVNPAYGGTSAAARKNILPDDLEKRMASLRGASEHLGVVPFASCAARSEDPYNSVDEANGIINWADGEDEDRAADSPVTNKLKAAQGFLYVKNAGEKRSDYIGPHHTVRDGVLAHSQMGTLRVAQAWANGKLEIPSEARAAVKSHLDSELDLWFGDGNSDEDDRQVQRLKLRYNNLFSTNSFD
jgi:HK97 family phage prohead protease